MTAERIEEMLKTYRAEVGRCGHLQMEMELLRKEIEADKAFLADDLAGPGAQFISDMPRGTAIGNPTEKLGIMLASGYISDEIREKEAKLGELQLEYNERHKTVVYVESWLAGLPERERWMIETQVIDGVIWREILTQYPEKFGEYRSKDTLKRIRDRALDMIYDMSE
ncbi:MAG: hypothetical protein J6W84_03490 [Bacteroidales bacterium]|nr:hypothetical protein [Bacteroidales bacterium]